MNSRGYAPPKKPTRFQEVGTHTAQTQSSLALCVEGGTEAAGELGGGALAPEVGEVVRGLLADHVIVERNNVDACVTERPYSQERVRSEFFAISPID